MSIRNPARRLSSSPTRPVPTAYNNSFNEDDKDQDAVPTISMADRVNLLNVANEYE